MVGQEIKIIAYYLPQYHPFPENDKWWGKGFTEWTNVGKAKPLFCNHYQPKVPADLGYYDLRIPEVREQQAMLAKEAGIYGFCYWHYWFGNGKQLLNEIIDEVHNLGKPDFPFCLGWANESWKAKQWRKDGVGDVLLEEQIYGDVDEYRCHFDYVKELFKDSRYIRINGNPFFLIYKPQNFGKIKEFIKYWNKWIKEEGIAEKVYFVGNLDDEKDFQKYINVGFDALTPGRARKVDFDFFHSPILIRKFRSFLRRMSPYPTFTSYKKLIKNSFIEGFDDKENMVPFIIPNWDHTPRSGKQGEVLLGSNPQNFFKHAKCVIEGVSKKENKIIMLKSWNEWGEGNYMEPDLKYGKGYLEALRSALKQVGEIL